MDATRLPATPQDPARRQRLAADAVVASYIHAISDRHGASEREPEQVVTASSRD